MSKSIYNTLAGLLAFTIITISTGCEKLIEIDPPLNQVTSDVVFTSDRLAASARSGMFSALSQGGTQSQNLTTFSSLQSDDLLYLGTNSALQEFNNNSYTNLSTSQSALFSEWYANIYRANAIIEGLESSTGTSELIRRQYTAEAQLVRAYCYFNLVNTFGDVPLVLMTDPNVTGFLPRAATADVYAQIIADLIAAKTNLGATYPAPGTDRTGVNKFVAASLLARVYLFTGNYAEAESNASEVIASGLYSLIPRATMGNSLFVRNSAESIWQMSPPVSAMMQYTNEATTFIPAATTLVALNYRLDPRFTSLFAGTDLRRINWMSNATFAGTVYTYPFKYKYRTQALAVAAGVSESQTVIRLAELYLIRAESRARIGSNLTGALADLNVIQNRAAATLSTSAVAATLLNDIALENRKEFFCEQAFRWNNLKRTGQADGVLAVVKSGYRPIAKLLPIPQGAIDANYNLIQNQGY
jgi:hypothetical protein